MKQSTTTHYFAILSLLLVPFLMGAAVVQLNDIQIAIMNKNFSQAEQLARNYIALQPQKRRSDNAQYYLGLSLLHQGKYLEAKEIFHELVRYRPEKRLRDQAYLGMIDAHNFEGHYDEAIEEANKLLKVSSDTEFKSLVYLKLARANLKLAQWDKARSYLEKIIHQFPDSLETYTATQLLEEKHYFAVQVGSFINRKSAEKLVHRLKEKGEYAYIVEISDKAGRKFFRVRVGQFSKLNDAKTLEEKLTELGYPTRIYP